MAVFPQVPSRTPPPSNAANAAQNAPINNDNVNQMAVCIAVLRALSRSVLAWVTTSFTRFSASLSTGDVWSEVAVACVAPDKALPIRELAGEASSTAPTTDAIAHARKP